MRIERLVYGGHGLAHLDGRAVLVPFSAPGDLVRIRISGTAAGVLRGSIEGILEPSQARREPACRHFGVCGGCHLQHVLPATQLAAKAEFVRDCLRRIGHVRWEGEIPVLSAAEYGWRSRTELHARRGTDGVARVGYFRAGSRELVAIDDCPILVAPLREEVGRLALDPPAADEWGGRLRCAAGDDGRIAREWTPPAGSGTVRQTIEGFDFAVAPGSFSQVNRPLAGALVRCALGDMRGREAVDLYAGAGLFALPLSLRFEQVHAVESDREAVQLGRGNAQANGAGNVKWSGLAVGEWLESGECPDAPDFLLLDPPRAGAGRAVIEAIARLRPGRIACVSCDPSTLARDLAILLGRGYVLLALTALDMFPQSYHVETVAQLAPASPDDPPLPA